MATSAVTITPDTPTTQGPVTITPDAPAGTTGNFPEDQQAQQRYRQQFGQEPPPGYPHQLPGAQGLEELGGAATLTGAAALPRTLSAIDGALQWMGFGAKAAPGAKTLLDVFPLAEESKPVVSHLLSDPAVRAAVAKAAVKLVAKGSIMGLGLKGIEHLFSSE